ncbi:MAG: glycosyltransferase family 39 protein, partial [Chloroflexi bacterium]|nr:glycosyltransferase family 39 protein [Chloroflexota bacterium]
MSEEETSTIDTGAASPEAAPQGVAGRLAAAGTSATRRPDWTVAAIVVILFIALLLRLWGVNWDGGLHLHPDERFLSFVTQDIEVPGSVGAYFDSENSKLNPYNRGGSFVYGTFPLFLTKIAGEAADKVESTPVIGDGMDLLFDNRGERSRDLTLAGYDGNLVGRTLSALFDTGTVFLVFLIGGLLFNRRVALLAAFLVAISAFHIQLSHFFTVDTFATFFTLLPIYFSVRISK